MTLTEQTAMLQTKDRMAVGKGPRSTCPVQFARNQCASLSPGEPRAAFEVAQWAAFPAFPGNNFLLALAMKLPGIHAGEGALPLQDAQAEKRSSQYCAG